MKNQTLSKDDLPDNEGKSIVCTIALSHKVTAIAFIDQSICRLPANPAMKSTIKERTNMFLLIWFQYIIYAKVSILWHFDKPK